MWLTPDSTRLPAGASAVAAMTRKAHLRINCYPVIGLSAFERHS